MRCHFCAPTEELKYATAQSSMKKKCPLISGNGSDKIWKNKLSDWQGVQG